jgi:hypothetical protein
MAGLSRHAHTIPLDLLPLYTTPSTTLVVTASYFYNPNRRPWTTDSVMIVTGSLYQKMAFTVHFPIPSPLRYPSVLLRSHLLQQPCVHTGRCLLAKSRKPCQACVSLFASTKVLAYIRSFDHVCFFGSGSVFQQKHHHKQRMFR